MLEWVNGRKTYIGLIAAGIFGILMSSGVIEWNPTTETIATIIATWTGVGITHKVEKAAQTPKAETPKAETLKSGYAEIDQPQGKWN